MEAILCFTNYSPSIRETRNVKVESTLCALDVFRNHPIYILAQIKARADIETILSE